MPPLHNANDVPALVKKKAGSFLQYKYTGEKRVVCNRGTESKVIFRGLATQKICSMVCMHNMLINDIWYYVDLAVSSNTYRSKEQKLTMPSMHAGKQ